MTTATQKGNTLHYKGSSFFKQRLILSVLSGKPIRITDIRARDDIPGLREFEVSLIRLLDKVTNGTVVELNEAGTALYFQPGLLYGGKVDHLCSVQRGIGKNEIIYISQIYFMMFLGYYLEALLMLGFFCKQPLHATLQGITSNNIDPSVDLIKTSMLQTLKKFVIDDEGLDIKICKRGKLTIILLELVVIIIFSRSASSRWR